MIIFKISAIRTSSEGEVLRKILKDYEPRVKPPTGNSTVVTVNIYVRKILNICSKNQEFETQLTIRSMWNDMRLDFHSESALIYITIADESLIWTPDLFFSNDVETKAHNIPKANNLIRIFSNGNVLFSRRVSVKLSCSMNFRTFPFDRQSCPLMIASYAYKQDELNIKWQDTDAIQVNHQWLPNFVFKNYSTEQGSRKTSTGSYSYIQLNFIFKRLTHHYLVTIYIPSTMIVILSWLSFFILPKDHVLKCIISLFSLITLTIFVALVNDDLPLTNYTRAIDLYTGICLTFVFCALIESIVVYYRNQSKTVADDDHSDKNVS